MVSFWRIAGRLVALRILSPGWRAAAFAAIGAALGAGTFVLHVSRAASYISDAPETCMNCHVMTTQYVTWRHGSHAGVATCNDCHVPHTSLPAHYAFKAKDGLWHATVFTMRWEPQVMRLSADAVPVVENNCRRCHAETIAEVALAEHASGDLRCWDCHREVPHGAVRSLSAVSDVFRPRLPSVPAPIQEPTIGGRRSD
ncbi:MAG: cytochrome c nitrite reductase small subunit [Pirellulales bacterium]|nr:cytochrome c nitrite reductase small subunit [Pirellulales bacterium]